VYTGGNNILRLFFYYSSALLDTHKNILFYGNILYRVVINKTRRRLNG